MVSGALLGGAAGAVISISIRAIDNYSKEFNSLNKNLKKQETTFQKLGKFIKSIGLGYAVLAGAAVGFGVDAVKSALKAETAMQSFKLIVGESADAMLSDMRRASRGMISDFELVSNANKAMALGIKKSDISGLLEVATARSKMFGRTASEAFNDLAIGIGRQSRMILDNLGIILDLDKVYADYALTIGKTAEEVRQLYAKEALVNAIMLDSAGIVAAQSFLFETHTEKIQRLSASWDNLKEKIGLVTLEYWDNVTGATALENAMKSQFDTAVGQSGAFDEISNAIVNLEREQKDLQEQIDSTNNAIKDQIDSLLNLSDITLGGERQKSLEIANQKEAIRQMELREARGEDLEDQLQRARDDLQIMRLEQEGYENQKSIWAAENALKLEQEGILETQNSELVAQGFIDTFALLKKEGEDIDILKGQKELLKDTESRVGIEFKNVQDAKTIQYEEEKKQIDELIADTDRLIAKYKEGGRARLGMTGGESIMTRVGGIVSTLFGGRNVLGVGDAIIRPNGQIIETDPQDTLYASKNGFGGGTSIYINIEGSMITENEMTDVVSKEIFAKLRTGISI